MKNKIIQTMIKKSNFLVLSLLLVIGIFAYLTFHHYELTVGLGDNSLCSVNSKIDCGPALTSSYSEIMGIPVAVFGGIFHLILLSFVVFYILGWASATRYLQNTIRFMLVLSVIASVVMGFISFAVIKVICPFCFATYLFSLINLFLGWTLVRNASEDFSLTGYFSEYRSHLIALACIPFLSWAVGGMIAESYNLSQLLKQVPEKIAIWKNGKTYNFDKTIGLTAGPENAKFELVEFADFKCPHCKSASSTLDLFLKSHPDVKLIFKPYPLDGTCNANAGPKGDGSRCMMAAITLCAQKLSGKGWDMHHWFFERQEKLFPVTDVKSLLPEIEKDLALKADELGACADSSEIYDMIKKSTEEANAAQVTGTPSIFLNGRHLPFGQFIAILKEAVK